jgi:hypothetical protein
VLKALWQAVLARVSSEGLLVAGIVTGWFALQFLVLPGLGVPT